MNMVNVDLLITVDLHLGKAKALHKNLFVVLDRLPVFIFLDDFF